MGDVGITAFIRYDNDDTVDFHSVLYVRADGIGRFDSLGRRGTSPWHHVIE